MPEDVWGRTAAALARALLETELPRSRTAAARESAAPAVVRTLEEIASEIQGCLACPLGSRRHRAVPGEGAPRARLMFVGEGPGEEEDRLGRPFVGAAGKLLDLMIAAMGLGRGDVFIANVVKCRPPGNRVPAPEEVAACLHFLWEQIEAVRPEVLCLLGRTAACAVLGREVSLSASRGKWHLLREYAVRVTFHPAYLLRNPEAKRESWEDLQAVMARLGLPAPQRTA